MLMNNERESEIFFQIHQDLPRESPGGNAFTRQAFEQLPPISQPRILDIGCGPGTQTLELARLTPDGQLIAIDIHQPYLDFLQAQAEALGWADRITCLNQSMFELPFPQHMFDIIWAEGSIYFLGFEQGLKQLNALIEPGGYLVVSELVWLKQDKPQEAEEFWQLGYPGMQTVENLVQIIPTCGYTVIHHFTLPETAWWNYYAAVETRINELKSLYANDALALGVLQDEEREIELYRQYSNAYGYEFFVMQKQ